MRWACVWCACGVRAVVEQTRSCIGGRCASCKLQAADRAGQGRAGQRIEYSYVFCMENNNNKNKKKNKNKNKNNNNNNSNRIVGTLYVR